jgi:hypothetical protein
VAFTSGADVGTGSLAGGGVLRSCAHSREFRLLPGEQAPPEVFRIRSPHPDSEVAGQAESMEAAEAPTLARVVTEGISPEQAVDEAIARIKPILSE